MAFNFSKLKNAVLVRDRKRYIIIILTYLNIKQQQEKQNYS